MQSLKRDMEQVKILKKSDSIDSQVSYGAKGILRGEAKDEKRFC